jgi:hypothetical protein
MLCDERLELGDQLGMPTESQVRLDPLFQGTDVQLVESSDRALGERLVGELGERSPAPQGERLAQQRARTLSVALGECFSAFPDKPLETVSVESVGRQGELVPLPVRPDQPALGTERLAKKRDGVPDDLRRRRRGRLAPQLVDQSIDRYGLVRVQKEQREEGALPPTTQYDNSIVAHDFERAEDTELHFRLSYRRPYTRAGWTPSGAFLDGLWRPVPIVASTATRPLEAVTDKGDTMTTPTRTARAIATALVVLAAALLATPATAEPKNGVPFVTAMPTASFAGEPKNAAPFTIAGERGSIDPLMAAAIRRHAAAGKLGSTIVHHPTAVERIVAQERGRKGDPLVFGLPQQARASVRIVERPGGFDWGDAGIGGAATLALVLLVAGGAALRHDNRRQAAHG